MERMILHIKHIDTRCYVFFFSSRRRHTRLQGDWSSDVCSSDLSASLPGGEAEGVALWDHETLDKAGSVSHRNLEGSSWRSFRSKTSSRRAFISATDRKSVVEGKSVDLGGRRII